MGALHMHGNGVQVLTLADRDRVCQVSLLHYKFRWMGGFTYFLSFQCVRVGKLLFGCKISAIVIAGWGGRGRGGLVVDRLGLGFGWLCWGGQRVSDLPLRRLERIWPKHYNLPPRCLSSIVRRIWPGLTLTPPLYWTSIYIFNIFNEFLWFFYLKLKGHRQILVACILNVVMHMNLLAMGHKVWSIYLIKVETGSETTSTS